MDPKTLRMYALVGVRARLVELADELSTLHDMLPSHPTLEAASAALRTASTEVIEVREVREVREAAKPTKTKAKRTSSNGAPNPADGGPFVEGKKSWQTGRDLLAVLMGAPGHKMGVQALAKRLRITIPATMWRIKVRTRFHHVECTGTGGVCSITAKGREALLSDLNQEEI